MKYFSPIFLIFFATLHTDVHAQAPAYLGEAKWVSAKQQKPEILRVTQEQFPVTKIISRDTGKKVSMQPIDPTTRLIHNGPTLPVVQNIRITGKKMSHPIMMDAPILQTRDNAGFNVSYTDKQHGFAGTNTTMFAEDSEHNIWISSDNGLYKYDGYHYFLYGPKSGLPALTALYIFYDSDHKLWLGSENGVYYIQHDSIFSLKTNEIDFSSIPCYRVQSDNSNNIWLSTKRNGAICINGSVAKVYDKRCGLPTNYVNALLLSKDGTLYIGTRDTGLIAIDKNRMRCFFGNSKNMSTHSIMSLYEDEDGIWAGSFLGGLLQMGKRDTLQYSISGKYNERIIDIKKAPGGMWIAAYSLTLCYFNKHSFLTIDETNGLVNRFPYMLFEDSFENLWVSNLFSGFSRVNEASFYVQPYANPAIGEVRRWLPDKHNGRWIITEGKNLQYQKGTETVSFVYKDKNNLEPFRFPLDGILAKDGTVWTGSYGPGIVRFNGTVNTAYVYSDFPTHTILRFVEQDTLGNIWFCPTDFGLIRYDNSKFTHYVKETGLLSNSVNKIYLDHSKQIYWSFDKGMQRLTNEKIETLFVEGKPFEERINELLPVDSRTMLLASDENGLFIVHDGKVYQFSKKSGLSSNTVKTMIRDKSGTVWITTDKGIESFALSGVNISEHNVYNQANGSFLTEVQNAFLDSAGIPFWSFGEKKLVYNPVFRTRHEKPPVFRFGDILIDNRHIDPNNTFKILPDQKISVNYTVIFWGRENNLAIKYLLVSERGDTSFYSPDKGHFNIGEIQPGNYRILLSAKDNNHTYYSAAFRLTVNNFWYNTWWSRLAMLLILITGIVYYFRRKAKKQSEINLLLETKVAEQTQIISQEKTELLKSYQKIDSQNQEKDVLIQEINHRVKNNLQFMIAMINMQLRKNYSDQTLEALLTTSNRIKAMSLVHEMLYPRGDSQGLSSEQYINELVLRIKDMGSDAEAPVHFNIDIIDINIDSRTGTSLGMIISELVTNSLKYAFHNMENPEITVSLSEAGSGNLKLIVSDNGRGIEKDYETKKGLGSRLVDIFSRQLKGTYTVDHANGFVYTLIFKPS